MNLATAQDEHARLRPHADALVDGMRRVSHAALAERIAGTARHLLMPASAQARWSASRLATMPST